MTCKRCIQTQHLMYKCLCHYNTSYSQTNRHSNISHK